jgi:hypothetical protein
MSLSCAADVATFAAADAMQAAYFHGFLRDERRQLVAEIAKREAEILKRTDAGQTSAIGRLRAQTRTVQAELKDVNRLIDGLTGRFAAPAAR